MEKHHYKYIHGPVSSWRLGRSLGVDPVSSTPKTCSFDCVYCQAGKTHILSAERKIFVPTAELIEELKRVPPVPLDYITFAGNGEPTLAKNLGEMIREIRTFRSEKIAVITNASLIDQREVQEDLALADCVVAKLDACSGNTLKAVNQPAEGIVYEEILEGLKSFERIFKGHLALQIMFVRSNRASAEEIAKRALMIAPDEIEINTPLRACAVKPLSPEELEEIAKKFRFFCPDIPVRSVYETQRKKSEPFNCEATQRRRGKEIH